MIVVYIIAGIIIAIMIVAALLPSKYNVETSGIIKRPKKEVMDKVGDFNYFAKWNPWQQMEPNASYKISGTPKTPGAEYNWKGRKIGEGRYILTGIDDKHIHFEYPYILRNSCSKSYRSKSEYNDQRYNIQLPFISLRIRHRLFYFSD